MVEAVNAPGMVEGSAPITEYVPPVVDYYMTVDGDDYLVIQHTAELALGADNGDFTVSLALIQTQDCNGEFRTVFHKGNNNDQRTPTMFKDPGTTGFYARSSTTASNDEGDSMATPAVDYNVWVYIAYHKHGQELTVFYDGVAVDSVTLSGESVANDGPLYIGKDPWYSGIVGAGYDNFQIHNRALTEEELHQVAAG